MVMPSRYEVLALFAQLADDTSQFVWAKPDIHRHSKVIQPELGFLAPRTNMHMRRLTALVRIEERPVLAPT
jgi:hypothetical protein